MPTTYEPITEQGRAILTAAVQAAAPAVLPATVQEFVDLLVDVTAGKKTPVELRDIIGGNPDLQDLFQALADQGEVADPGSGQTVANFRGQINLGSQIVQDLVAGNQVNIRITINNVDGSTEVSSSDRRRMIYLSHLAVERDAQDLLQEIGAALRKAGYTVPPHEDRLTDAAWQPELFDQIGRCQGAVLLLSPAALQSELLAFEAALLLSRPTNSTQYPYVLCKVYAPGVTDADLAGSPLGSLPWDGVPTFSVSAAADGAAPNAAVAAQVVDHFQRGLPDPEEEEEKILGPLAAIELRIAGAFSATPAWELRNAIRALDDTLPTALPAADLRIKVAQALLGTNLRKARSVFQQLLAAGAKPDAVAQVFRLTAATWVDPRSATWVALATRRPARQRALGLNTLNPETAQLCVLRACDLRPDYLWPAPEWATVPITNAGGGLSPQARADELISEVGNRLQLHYRCDIACAKDSLVEAEKAGEPVLVLIPSEYPDNLITAEALARLQGEFPTVTFLLLLGGTVPDPEAWPLRPTPIIRPPLADDSEFIKAYSYDRNRYARVP